jgi:hypothetical protein
MSLYNCEILSFLLFQIIFQSHINILEKIIAAHQSAFVFFDLQELFDEFNRNVLFCLSLPIRFRVFHRFAVFDEESFRVNRRHTARSGCRYRLAII